MTTAGAVLAAARATPASPLAAVTASGPLLILSPHPDDESLGCGGLIAACAQAGIPIIVALLTDGAASHPGSRTHPPATLASLRATELREALVALGLPATSLHELNYPDSQAPTAGPAFHAAAARLAQLAAETGAATILTAWGCDPHCDHEAAEAIARAAARTCNIACLAYPVWGLLLPPETPVTAGPPLRLDITQTLPAKRRAIACHRSQHGQIVTDAPDAFTLPDALIAACTRPDEIFFRLAA